MKDNETRLGGELTELARLVPVPLERDLPADREQTLKEHLMIELRTPDGGLRMPGRAPEGAGQARARSRRPKRTILGGAAGACVLAVTAIALSPVNRQAHPVASPQSRPTGAQLLARIADAASGQTSPAVGDNQYEYVRVASTDAVPKEHIIRDKDGNLVSLYYTYNGKYTHSQGLIWSPVTDVCKDGFERSIPAEPHSSSFFTSAGPGRKCPNIGGLNNPSYRLLQSLPTNPRILLNLINGEEKGHGSGPAEEAFTTIGDLMNGSVLPPQLSAALFRAAAMIPGVIVIQDAADATGQHGVAVALDSHFLANGRRHNSRQEWIFNKTTLQMIGEATVADGTLTTATTIPAEGFVDHIGQIPHGGRG
jgi:hypothetical protein